MKRSSFILLGALFLMPATRGEVRSGLCQTGVRAFEKSLHALVRANCIKCHEGVDHGFSRGPAHSVADVELSYTRLKKYVNFDDIPSSYLVKKGGNMHCLSSYEFDCKTSGRDIQAALEQWWENGERRCPQHAFVTGSLPLPSPLPGRNQGFTTMRWDLEGVTGVRRTAFEMDIQRFAEARPGMPGAYRFRKPRLLTQSRGLFIKDVRVLINGKEYPLATGYQAIEVFVSPEHFPRERELSGSPVLSSKQLIALADKGASDQISIAFGNLSLALPSGCKATDKFQANVMPVLEARQCYACHGGGPDHLAGTSPARDRFNMDSSPEVLCRRSLERSDLHNPELSAFINYPIRRANGHPQVLPWPEEIVPAWAEWLAAENDAGERRPVSTNILTDLLRWRWDSISNW